MRTCQYCARILVQKSKNINNAKRNELQKAFLKRKFCNKSCSAFFRQSCSRKAAPVIIKYCLGCKKLLIKRDTETNHAWTLRKHCNIRCTVFAKFRFYSNERARLVCQLFSTGQYTYEEIGNLKGVSTERIRQILNKHYADKAELKRIIRQHKVASINRLLISQGRQISSV